MLNLRWADQSGLTRYEKALMALGSARMAQAENRAVNRTGDMARTQVRRSLTRQTGLKRRTIVKAVRTHRSSPATLTYTMKASGGDVALKYFGARETARGVSAAPFGQRRVFPHTFIKGGTFPNRVGIGMGGHVFARTGGSKFPIEKQKSGVIIPAEMVKGATAEAFTSTVARVLPQRVMHEVARLTGGVMTRPGFASKYRACL